VTDPEIIGIALGAGGILTALGVPIGIERLKRPSLDIVPSPWTPAGPAYWTFAAVRVRRGIHESPTGEEVHGQSRFLCLGHRWAAATHDRAAALHERAARFWENAADSSAPSGR
jgi:hypothetical protein